MSVVYESTFQHEVPQNYRDSLTIADEYLNERRRAHNAIHSLNKRGNFGTLLAAEVAIDYASLSRSFEERLQLLTQATDLLSTACEAGKSLPHTQRSASVAPKAQMRLDQMPALAELLLCDRLPDEETAATVYKENVTHAKELVDNRVLRHSPNKDAQIEAHGIMGELAVAALLQRFAIREVMSETWWPFQSFLREDHGGSCLVKTTDPSWDITCMTRLTSHEIEAPYRVSIKTMYNRKYYPDDHLFIDPDLRLYIQEKYLPQVIINSCFYELDNSIDSSRITAELDDRTDKLLTALDEKCS